MESTYDCPNFAVCENTDGGYNCTVKCPIGFKEDGITCTGIDRNKSQCQQ